MSRIRISGRFTASNLCMISTNFGPTVGHNTSCHIVKVFAVCCDGSAKSFEGCSISPLAEVVVAAISLHLPLVGGIFCQSCEGIDAIALSLRVRWYPVIFALDTVLEIPSRLLAAPSHGCSVGTNLDSVESGRNGAGSGFGGEVNNIAVVAQICSTNCTYSCLIGCCRLKGSECVGGFFDVGWNFNPGFLIDDAILYCEVFVGSAASRPSDRGTVGSLAVCGQSQIGRCRTILECGEVCTGGIIADEGVGTSGSHLPFVGGSSVKLIQSVNAINQICFGHIYCIPILSSILSVLQSPVGLCTRSPAQGNRICG